LKQQIPKEKYLDKIFRRIRYFARACFWFTMIAIISETSVNFKPIPIMIAFVAFVWVCYQVWINLFNLVKYWNKDGY